MKPGWRCRACGSINPADANFCIQCGTKKSDAGSMGRKIGIALLVLLAPWTITVLPFLGFWFPIFLAQYRIYADLNADLRIEEQFIPIEGDPWRKDSFEELGEPDEDGALPDDGIRRWEALLSNIEKNKEAKP